MMPDGRKDNGGARPGAGRKHSPHRRRRLSKSAVQQLDAELAWLTEDVQDEVLSALIERAPRDWWDVAIEVAREMGLTQDGVIPGGDDTPIML